MSLHNELPIYKPAYDLSKLVVRLTGNFPREHKPVFGRQLLVRTTGLLNLVYRANKARDGGKIAPLDQVSEAQAEIEAMFSLALDLRMVSQRQYADAIALTTSLGKQANAWKRKYATSPVT